MTVPEISQRFKAEDEGSCSTFKIRFNSLRSHAFRQHDCVPLRSPGDQCLRGRHVELFRDVCYAWVVKDSVSSMLVVLRRYRLDMGTGQTYRGFPHSLFPRGL